MKNTHNVMITERAKEVATRFVLCKDATVRSIADEYGLSKSTVHLDLTERLKQIGNIELYGEVQKKLSINKMERHIRGGESTKKKYLSKRKSR